MMQKLTIVNWTLLVQQGWLFRTNVLCEQFVYEADFFHVQGLRRAHEERYYVYGKLSILLVFCRVQVSYVNMNNLFNYQKEIK